ncbi:MAG: PKD domain-containing protein [Candidatus Acetothermia bacterium]
MKVGKYFVLIALLAFLTIGLNGCKSNKEPVADFSVNPGSGEAPLEVVLDASGSGDEDGVIDSYEWDFDDGNESNGRTVEHTFASDGEYTVTLTVTDNDGATATTTTTIDVQNSPPAPELDPEPTEGERPLQVAFDMSDSEDGDGVIEEYQLEFGDDSDPESGTDILDLVEHTYEDAGEYTATLTVVDDDGLENSTTKTIQVEEPPPENEDPEAAMDVSSSSGTEPLEVDFSASESSDPDGEIESYEWSFGDGNTATGAEVSHRYESAGDFEVTLLVTDDREGTDRATATIEVEPATYYVGETASNDTVRMTLRGTETTETIRGRDPGAGKEFVIVDVTIRARRDGVYPSKTLNFTLRDSEGGVQPISLETSALDDYFPSGVLDEDDVAQGRIAFVGRSSSDYFTLTYEAPGQSPIKYKIDR